ncbi:MAG: hypothetical protein DRP85_08815 [Candidatus Makaraimicrobium thalassicum]|nr:MAG: hypothetical protein DRP85_08815 [Candidatus Omnitrophota bacterium]
MLFPQSLERTLLVPLKLEAPAHVSTGRRACGFPVTDRLAYLGGDSLMIKKNKEFDTVLVMREIQDELSRRYGEDSSAEGRDLQEIRERYWIKRGRNDRACF